MNNLKTTLLISMLFFMSLLYAKADIEGTQIGKQLPMLLGSSNAGTEFFLAFHPCWETNGKKDGLKIYVTSAVATKVTVSIEAHDFIMQKMTIPNGIIEFNLPPARGQCYTKTDRIEPQPQQVFKGKGIIVSSADPIVVYGVTRFQYTSDGYLAIPTNGLGRKYIVSSWNDPGPDNGTQFLTSYTSIVTAYDKTDVTIVLGGEPSNYTPGKDRLVTGDSFKRRMNRGDVWLIGVMGDYNDLSGTTVTANKPVAVISGSFCAYIPIQKSACDFLISQDIPMETWGKKYHVTPITERKNASFMRIYTSVDSTIIKRNGIEWAKIETSGGAADKGYISRRPFSTDYTENLGYVPPAIISSDQKISITQYNCGQSDDGISSDPFQMVLTPIEQYQDEIVWCTPGVKSGSFFKVNYLNLCYQSDNGKIPDDMEFGKINNDTVSWRKLVEVVPTPGLPFDDPDITDGNTWNALTIKLEDPAGVYALRGEGKFTAYIYGFDHYDSYGFQASAAFKDLSKPDIWAPHFKYSQACNGYCKGTTTDQPKSDPSLRSNLGHVGYDKNETYNYNFIYDVENFFPGETYMLDWELEVEDPNSDAQAVLNFNDRAGNDTTVTITYHSTKFSIRKAIEVLGEKKYNDPPESREFTLVNQSALPVTVDSIVLLSSDINENWDYNGFHIDSEIYKNGILPSVIEPNEEIKFKVVFDPSTVADKIKNGQSFFADSIGIKANWSDDNNEHCYYKYRAIIQTSQIDRWNPVPEYTMNCEGYVSGIVRDEPQKIDSLRSNMASITLNKDESYNYILEYDDFVSGISESVNWYLTREDLSKAAKAVITFTDAKGNDTIITVEYTLKEIISYPEISIWENIKEDDGVSSQSITIMNESVNSILIDSIFLRSSQLESMAYNGFILFPEAVVNLPVFISPNSSIEIKVSFSPSYVWDEIQEGKINFLDSIGVKAEYNQNDDVYCYNKYIGAVKANIDLSACILANDLEFEDTKINNSKTDTVTIENYGKENLIITEAILSSDNGENNFLAEIKHGGPAFDKISLTNPLIIKPNGYQKIDITFTPTDTIDYSAKIVFESNVDANNNDCDVFDNIIEINAKGIPDGNAVNGNNTFFTVQKIIPNPILNDAIIHFTVIKTGDFKFELFDEQGKKVKLLANTYFTKGNQQIPFSVGNLSSGIYFIKMSSGNIESMQKVIIQ